MNSDFKKPKNKDRARSNPHKAPAASGPFKESLADQLGNDMMSKLRKHLEDQQKRKIREAMNDPKVQQAAKKFAKSLEKKTASTAK
ncbi:MAG TPA: hypothetical protein VLM37_12355 [Fibrobacteraceae bacterium]|nr:hypothetical protein [Fibrobacteraceae bacterium]